MLALRELPIIGTYGYLDGDIKYSLRRPASGRHGNTDGVEAGGSEQPEKEDQ
jgi:hypothetical protein